MNNIFVGIFGLFLATIFVVSIEFLAPAEIPIPQVFLHYLPWIPDMMNRRLLLFPIEAGAISLIVTGIIEDNRKKTEKKEMQQQRNLAFAALLHNSRNLDKIVVSIQVHLIEILSIQYSVADEVINEKGGVQSILQLEIDDIEKLFETSIRAVKDDLRSRFRLVNPNRNHLEKLTYLVDDTIEAHINSLDFESSFFANKFRSEIRALFYFLEETCDDVIRMIEAIEDADDKENLEKVNEIYKSIKSGMLRNNADEIKKIDAINSVFEHYFGHKLESKSDDLLIFIEKKIKKIKYLTDDIKLWSKVLRSFVGNENQIKIKRKELEHIDEEIIINHDKDEKLAPGEYYVIEFSNGNKEYLKLDGLVDEM